MEPVLKSKFLTNSSLFASRFNNLAEIVVEAAIFAKYGNAMPASPENCPNAALIAIVFVLVPIFLASSYAITAPAECPNIKSG